MATHHIRIIDPKNEKVKHSYQGTWEVMKPFVKFSFNAIKFIGLTLITIIRALPSLKPHKDSTEIKRR